MNKQSRFRKRRVFSGRYSRLCVGAVGCVLLVLAGCHREDIHEYHVPREIDDMQEQQSHQQDPASSASAEVVWDVPSSWILLDKEVSMRLATFRASNGQEIALSVFPGDVGGLLANVNRWRRQVGLAPTDEAGLGECTKQVNGVNVIVVDVAGTTLHLIGTVINVGDGNTWFVKAVGPSELVELIKLDLVKFSASFHVDEAGNNHNHSDHDGHDHGDDAAVALQDTTSVWTKPAQWSKEENASPILSEAFVADSGARITLTALTGDGGGTLENINRWRGQMGLDPVVTMEELETQSFGDDALIVDIATEDGSKRIVAGIIPAGSRTLFFKLTGAASQVESELERFRAFVVGVGLGREGEL